MLRALPDKRNAESAVKILAIETSMGRTSVALKRPGEPMLAKIGRAHV